MAETSKLTALMEKVDAERVGTASLIAEIESLRKENVGLYDRLEGALMLLPDTMLVSTLREARDKYESLRKRLDAAEGVVEAARAVISKGNGRMLSINTERAPAFLGALAAYDLARSALSTEGR